MFPTQITKREVERTRYDALDDMASTTSLAMLGLSVGCARCHDHKYDPISLEEYYGFVATFTTTVRSEIEIDLDPAAHRAALARFDAELEPVVAARSRYERDVLPDRLRAWAQSILREDDQRVRAALEGATSPWTTLTPRQFRSHGGATLTPQPDGSLLASGDNPNFDTYTIVAETHARGVTAVRLEALAHESFQRRGPGRASNGNIGLSRFRLVVSPLEAQPDGEEPARREVTFERAVATFEQNSGHLSVAASLEGRKGRGWALDPQFGKDHAAVFTTTKDFGFEGGTRLEFTLEFRVNDHHNIGRPRLSISTAPRPVDLEGSGPPEEFVNAIAALVREGDRDARDPLARLSPEQRQALLAGYQSRDEEWRRLDAAVREVEAKRPQPKRTKVQVSSEGVRPMRHHSQGADFFPVTHVLARGDPDQKEDVASPGFLRALTRHPDGTQHWRRKPPDGAKTSHRRHALADWITDVEHGAGHLLARVIVNRVWRGHFGRGIVATPNDFGARGSPPTHPGLLDWLASELIGSGWRLSHIHRLILTSQTYRTSTSGALAGGTELARDTDLAPERGADRETGSAHESAPEGQPELDPRAADPDVELYWRWVPRRLEAEAIRDSLLFASGVLDDRSFGPGTLDSNSTRRSIYFTVKRSRLVSMLCVFDFPEPLSSQGSRPSTTVAPQALWLLNNETIRTWSRSFAADVDADLDSVELGDRTEAAVERVYERCLTRSPDEDERAASIRFLRSRERAHEEAERSPAFEWALADFCQVVLGLSEFLFVP